jgi:glutamate decarboxylase
VPLFRYTTHFRPFAYPAYEWDFKIPRVQSINASGWVIKYAKYTLRLTIRHKYGMTTAGCGWIIWRGAEYLPKELIFELHYLGAVSIL